MTGVAIRATLDKAETVQEATELFASYDMQSVVSDLDFHFFVADRSGDSTDPQWGSLSLAENNHQLFLKQKTMLAMFLERGAITRAQHDKSLHDLREKMGETD